MQIKITEQNLADIKGWFSAYLNTFRMAGSGIPENIKLKKDHSLRVCREILRTGRKLGLNEDELRLAEIIRDKLPQSPDIDNIFSHLFEVCSHYRPSDRV